MDELNAFLGVAREALLEARALNPLLPDHAANLARLHQIWAGHATPAADHVHVADVRYGFEGRRDLFGYSPDLLWRAAAPRIEECGFI